MQKGHYATVYPFLLLMQFFRYLESRMHTFTVWDYGVFKITLFAFALMIAKVWPEILSLERYRYGLIFIVGYLYILAKMFSK